MKEIWKDIPGCEGQYQISSKGRCRSLERIVVLHGVRGCKTKCCYRKTKGALLAQHDNGHGYIWYYIGSNRRKYAHRLVAEVFIPNPDNKPEIDHINGVRSDNRVENLRWVNRSENMSNPLTVQQRVDKNGIPVYQFDIHGIFIKKWDSMTGAAKTLGVSRWIIKDNLEGKCQTVKGTVFRYSRDFGEQVEFSRTVYCPNGTLNKKMVVEIDRATNKLKAIYHSAQVAAKHFGKSYNSVRALCLRYAQKGEPRWVKPSTSPHGLLMYLQDASEEVKEQVRNYICADIRTDSEELMGYFK